MLMQLLRFGLFVKILLHVRKHLTRYLSIVACLFFILYVHSEVLSWAQIRMATATGEEAEFYLKVISWCYLFKNIGILLICLVLVWFYVVETRQANLLQQAAGPTQQAAVTTDSSASLNDDGFNFLREKDKLRPADHSLLIKKDDSPANRK